jgi:hypothetical protein
MRAEIRIHVYMGTVITTDNMNTVYVSCGRTGGRSRTA